jgi:ATP-dependent DNA helicase RecG
MEENLNIEKKSIRFLSKNPDWNELSKDCVSMANARGGFIFIGIEDDASLPPKGQKIEDRSLPEQIQKAITHRTINVAIAVTFELANNKAEFIKIQVFRSVQTIASTTDGKYYIRVSDECRPVPPDEMARLAAEKNAFIWEEQTSRKVPENKFDDTKMMNFTADVRNSKRVSSFVKEKSDEELLDYYFFRKDKFLTNLGILWIGKREDRAGLLYSPSIQVIRYNERDEKVWKLSLDDFNYNPKELLEKVLVEVPDWQESIEISDGVFRKNIPFFPQEVVRELVANALVHRTYTTRGDIFINIYHDRLEVHSPGRLPYGVTPSNILNQSVRRNEYLSKVFYDLALMEKEGSGYDLIYANLLGSGKALPQVKEGNDRVSVIIQKQFISKEVVKLMDKANQEYQLRQKEIISLGLIAQHQSLSALELSKLLNQEEEIGLRNWLGRLLDIELIMSTGKTRGTQYHVNPEYLRKLDFKGKTTLKNIEDYRLEELIYKDIEAYPCTAVSDIHERIGKEINIHKIRRMLKEMTDDGRIFGKGEKRWRRYAIEQKLLNNQ